MSGLNILDMNTRQMVENQWNQVVGEGLIKKNIDDLFKVFPGRAIHIGDTWKVLILQYKCTGRGSHKSDFEFVHETKNVGYQSRAAALPHPRPI